MYLMDLLGILSLMVGCMVTKFVPVALQDPIFVDFLWPLINYNS